MADKKKTIEVDIIASAEKLKKELKEASAAAGKFEHAGSAAVKQRLKVADLLKNKTTNFNKLNAKSYKENLKKEKDLSRAMDMTARAMHKKLNVHKEAARHTEFEIRQLSKLKKVQDQIGGGGDGSGGPGGAGSGGGRRRGRRGIAGRLGRYALGAGAAAGIFLAHLATSQLSSGYSAAEQYGLSHAGLSGTGARLEDLQRLRAAGLPLGYNPLETSSQAQLLARQTGQIGATTTAQQLSRTIPMDVGEAAGFMGTLTRGGQGFGGKAGTGGRNELIKTLGAGVRSGLDQARIPEYFQGVDQLLQSAQGVSAGNVSADAINAIMSGLGKSGLSGFQGARGAAVVNQFDQAVKNPGAGEAGDAFILQALGFGKPGGNRSFYEARRLQQRGITGAGGLETLKAVFSESKAQYGGGEEQILALNSLTGLSIDQLEAMREVVESGMSTEQQTKALARIQEQGKSLEEKTFDQIKEFGETAVRIAGLEDRSITIGEAIADDIHSIQEDINSFVDDSLPLMVDALDIISTGVKGITSFINDNFGTDIQAARSEMHRDRNIERSKEREKESLSILRNMPEFPSFLGGIRNHHEISSRLIQAGGQNYSAMHQQLVRQGMQDPTSNVYREVGPTLEHGERVSPAALAMDLNKLIQQQGNMAAAVTMLVQAFNEGNVANRRPSGTTIDTSGGTSPGQHR